MARTEEVDTRFNGTQDEERETIFLSTIASPTNCDIIACGSIGTSKESDSDGKALAMAVTVKVKDGGLSLGLGGDCFSVTVQDKAKIAPFVATGRLGALKSKAARIKAHATPAGEEQGGLSDSKRRGCYARNKPDLMRWEKRRSLRLAKLVEFEDKSELLRDKKQATDLGCIKKDEFLEQEAVAICNKIAQNDSGWPISYNNNGSGDTYLTILRGDSVKVHITTSGHQGHQRKDKHNASSWVKRRSHALQY
jgi:hypothetical protein